LIENSENKQFVDVLDPLGVKFAFPPKCPVFPLKMKFAFPPGDHR